MKVFVTVLFLFAVCLTMNAQNVGRTESGKATSVKKAVAKTTPLPADGKDPVCFMKVKKGTLITVSYNKTIYGFCSEHCKGVFAANPAAQLK